MIYLDNHATTQCDRRVAKAIYQTLTETPCNANSNNGLGEWGRELIAESQTAIGNLINCQPQAVTFTSGATESINLAIRGTLMAYKRRKPVRVAISAVEHKAVTTTCEALVRRGLIDELLIIPVDRQCNVSLPHIKSYCRKGLDLLCVMAANNEVGTIQPVKEIAAIANHYGIPYLCDASQAVGKIPLDFDQWKITMLVCSGHKLYGPQGIGALVIKNGHPIRPILYGGGDELRPGTPNLPLIVGFGEACRLCHENYRQESYKIQALRDYLQRRLMVIVPGIVINGNSDNRLAGNLHFSAPYANGISVVDALGDDLICSTGSACSAMKSAPSSVLTAMRMPPQLIQGSIRLGIGRFNTQMEMDRAARLLAVALMQERMSASCGCN